MKIQKIGIIVSLCFCVSLARAQYYVALPPGAGPYFRMGAGPTFFQQGTLKSYSGGNNPFVNGPQNQTVNYDVGVSADAAFGWAFNQYIGLDFESGYVWGRINNIPGYDVNGSTIANVPFLGNLTLSLPIPHTNIVPYIGGGAGGAESIFDAHSFSDSPPTQTLYGEESDTVFAYQAFAGVRFMLAPNFSLGVGYQYFATGGPTFSYPPGPNVNASFSGVHTHSVMFTLQYNF
jgi:opacity protein-like surface antigen